MVYVKVKEASKDKLKFVKNPEARAWAILCAVITLGFGAAFYSDDYLLWKITYVSGAVFVGLNCMEDWEHCVFDKVTRKVTVSRKTLIQKIFQLSNGASVTSCPLDEILSVSVEKEEVKYVGNGYLVVLHFAPGYSLGITETATLGDKREHELVAEKISHFLDLNLAPKSNLQDENDTTISSSDDDDFEQIDKEELTEGYDEETSSAQK